MKNFWKKVKTMFYFWRLISSMCRSIIASRSDETDAPLWRRIDTPDFNVIVVSTEVLDRFGMCLDDVNMIYRNKVVSKSEQKRHDVCSKKKARKKTK
jgi:hypothetical protein